MKTVILGTPPPEIEAVIARRRALGQDTHDEIWQGEYHMAPAPHQWHGYLVAQLHDALKPLARQRGSSDSTPSTSVPPTTIAFPTWGWSDSSGPTSTSRPR